MGFSSEWNDIYLSNSQMVVWPWSDLVSYVMRYAKPANSAECNVLELGCGAGANINFFKSLGVNYYALEGSRSIVQMLKNKFPELSDNIKEADYTRMIPFDKTFDIVVDRASLTHNDTESIQRCLSIIRKMMKPKSAFIGIDWFSISHSDFQKGKLQNDEFTRSSFKEGQFAGVGNVHFSDENHIKTLFEGFDLKVLEEKRVLKIIPNNNHIFASWNFYAIRK